MYDWYYSPIGRLLNWFRQRRQQTELAGQMETFGGNEGMQIAHMLSAYGRVPIETLTDVLTNDALYPHFRYHRFTKPKKDGTQREISAPEPSLKRIQKYIYRMYLKRAPVHAATVGYRRHKSAADHARTHAGAALILTADIEDFFPNTAAWRVEAWWKTQFEAPEAVRLLTLLTTDRGGLPQGAPSSPALSNVVNIEMDEALQRRAQSVGAVYSRYCDDLAFSWGGSNSPRGTDGPPSDFERGIRAALREFGYTVHDWKLHQRHDQPQMTGVVLLANGSVDIPPAMRERMRQLARSSDPYDASRLQGYQNYAASVRNRRVERGGQ